jgi:hypothetical protein
MFELLVSLLIGLATPPSPVAALSAAGEGDEEIERVAREYRIQVYHAFHRNRPEYNSRSEAGDRVLSGYRRSGRLPEHREILKGWFVEARGASSPGQIRPLPHLPDFAAELPAAARPAGRTADSAPIGRQQASPGLAAAPSTGAALFKSWSTEPSVAGRVGGALLRAAINRPRDSAADPVPQLQVDVGPPLVEGAELATAENAEPILVDTSNMVPVPPQKHRNVKTREINDLAADSKPARPDTDEVAEPAQAAQALVEAAPSPIPTVADQDVVPSQACQRLTATIKEFNHAINDLVEETKVDSPARLFDVARLLNDLVGLDEQRRKIASQFESLPAADRAAIPALLPIELAAAGLQAKINKTQSELDAGGFFDSDEERRQALELLNVLKKQLQALLEEA